MTKFQWEQKLSKYLSELPEEENRRILEYYDELFQDKYEFGENEESIIASFGEPAGIALEILRSYDTGAFISGEGYAANRNSSGTVPPPIPQNRMHGKQRQRNGTPVNNPGDNSSYSEQNNDRVDDIPPINNRQSHNANNHNGDAYSDISGSSSPNKGAQRQNNVPPRSTIHNRARSPLMVILYLFFFVVVGIPILSTLFGIFMGAIGIVIAFAACSIAGIVTVIAAVFVCSTVPQMLVLIGAGLVVSGIGFAVTPVSVKLIKIFCNGFGKIMKVIHGFFFGKINA